MTDCYTLILQRSRFTVQAFAGGMLSRFAHSPIFAIRRFTGEVHFTPDPVNLSLQITVQANSLELTGNVSEKDHQEIQRTLFEQVLETDKFPLIVFNSTAFAATKVADNWFRTQIRGEMQLHGMTMAQQIDAQLRVLDDKLRLSGDFPLSLSAYKLQRISALAGTIQVKDEIKFAFEFVGRKQESAQ